MNNRSKEMKDFVLLSIFVAIILLLSVVPQIGYVTILPGVSITLVHIPVLIGVFTFRRLRESLILGFSFGISSFIASLIYAVHPFDLAFQLPWIAIIPRVLFAVVAYYLIILFEKINIAKNGKLIVFIVVFTITSLGIFFGLRATIMTVAHNKVNTTQALVSNNEVTVVNQELLIIQNEADITANGLYVIYLEDQLDNTSYLESTTKYINGLIQGVNEDTAFKTQQIELLKANNDERNLELISLRIELLEHNANLKSRVKTATIILYVLTGVLVIGFLSVYYVFTYRKKDVPVYIPSSFIIATFVHTLLVLATVGLFSPAALMILLGENQNVISMIFTLAATNGLVEALVAMIVGVPIVIALTNLRQGELDTDDTTL